MDFSSENNKLIILCSTHMHLNMNFTSHFSHNPTWKISHLCSFFADVHNITDTNFLKLPEDNRILKIIRIYRSMTGHHVK